MERISEECWCAGWMTGLEFGLWEIANAGGGGYGQGTVTKDDAEAMLKLSSEAGGWHEWNDDAGGCILTPILEWEEKYERNRVRH